MTSLGDERRTVLLVEDEPMLRASIVRGLGRLLDVEVVAAGSVKEAVRALDTVEPALLLSDLDLPDGSGIEVVAALERRGSHATVVFISAYIGKYRSQLARRSDVEIYEKPVPLERLRNIVEKALEHRPVDWNPFGVADYVQLAALGRHSVVIEVRGIRVHGRIVIEHGEARSAVDNIGRGVEAFRRLAFLESAAVHCRSLARGETFPPNIEGPCAGVLLDAARAHDETKDVDLDWGESEVKSGTAPHATQVRGGTDSRQFTALYDDGIQALLEKDYRRAFEAFRRANELAPDDSSVRANLARLTQMGYGS